MQSMESVPRGRASSDRSPAERLVVEHYKNLLLFVDKKLRSSDVQTNSTVDAQDIVQQAVQNFISHKDTLRIAPTDPGYDVVALAYLYTTIRNQLIDVWRDRRRTRTYPSGEVDIAPEKIVGPSPISQFSLGESKDPLEEIDESYVSSLAFGPLSFEGDLDSADLRAQRSLHIFKLRLEGMSSKDIAREIFASDSRYASISPQYDFDDPQDMKKAANLVDKTLERVVPDILKDMQQEILGDGKHAPVNERLIRALWDTTSEE